MLKKSKLKINKDFLCNEECPYKVFKDENNNVHRYPPPNTNGDFFCLNKNTFLPVAKKSLNLYFTFNNCEGKKDVNIYWFDKPEKTSDEDFIRDWYAKVEQKLDDLNIDDLDPTYGVNLPTLIVITEIYKNPIILKFNHLELIFVKLNLKIKL